MFTLNCDKLKCWFQFGHNEMYGGYEGHIALFYVGFSIGFDFWILSWNLFIGNNNLSFHLDIREKRKEIFTIFYKKDDGSVIKKLF